MPFAELVKTAYQRLPESVYAATAALVAKVHALFPVELDVAPPSATEGIFFATLAKLNYKGTGGFSGAGHAVAALGHTVMDAASQTAAALYGLEGKLEVLAGNVTSAIAVEGQISAVPVGATVASYTAFNGQAAGVAGAITNCVIFAAAAPSGAGAITNYFGFQIAAPVVPSANAWGVVIADLVGSSTSLGLVGQISNGAGKFNLFCSGTAPNHLVGDLRIGADTSGVTGAACVVNGAIAVVDGMTAPAAVPGYAVIYVDTADGDLKVKFADGVTKVLAADS